MSQGPIFNLVLRDERFDKWFTASDYLRQRLDAIRAKREEAGESNVQPTFADIDVSHRLYVRATYRPYVAIASEYVRVKPSGDGTAALGAAGGTCEFTFPIYGHFTSDLAIRVRFQPVGSPTATAATPETPFYRYCAFPGARLLQRVELKSDGVVIDDHTPDDVMAAAKFFVRADHRAGWDRCHGQQESREATYLANGFTGTLLYREGPQTPRLYQESFEMLVPLNFWLCRDASHALLNDLIPNSQRVVSCSLAPLGLILQALAPDPAAPGHLMPVPLPVSRLGVTLELFVNNLFTNPEIHDVFASRVGFSLIRVHRRQTHRMQSAADRFLLDQLKYPAEFFLVGVRSRELAADFDRWWLMGTPAARPDTSKLMVPAMLWNVGLGVCQLVCREAVEVSSLDTAVETIGITAHGIELYPQLAGVFYNAYLPIRYAENSMTVSPVDTSAFLINFCLYPGQFEPSGHYNLSAGRELYIDYTLKPAAPDATLNANEMVISMSALNFLIRSGDGVRLKYSL